jgi:large subunit ribosomal protein L13
MTVSVPSEAIERRWHVVDAGGQVLGRLASQVAHLLRGKHKPVFSPHVDAGDFVIVINAAKVRLTGRKLEGKIYYRHTGYPGSVREMTAAELLEKHPERMIEKAVRGMLPKNALGRRMLRKLKVYSEAEHPHAAQKPEALEIHV